MFGSCVPLRPYVAREIMVLEWNKCALLHCFRSSTARVPRCSSGEFFLLLNADATRRTATGIAQNRVRKSGSWWSGRRKNQNPPSTGYPLCPPTLSFPIWCDWNQGERGQFRSSLSPIPSMQWRDRKQSDPKPDSHSNYIVKSIVFDSVICSGAGRANGIALNAIGLFIL